MAIVVFQYAPSRSAAAVTDYDIIGCGAIMLNGQYVPQLAAMPTACSKSYGSRGSSQFPDICFQSKPQTSVTKLD